MSYPRNAATPKAVSIGPLVKVSDGSLLAVTTGVNVRVQLDSGSWGAGGGTIAVDATGGVFTYAPSQAETNGDVLNVVLYIAGYISATTTIFPDPAGLKVDVDTIKTKGVTVDSGGTTFPAAVGSSTLAAGAKMDLADSLNQTGVTDLKTKLGTIPASGNWNTVTPATPGAKMDIVDAPNAIAIAAFKPKNAYWYKAAADAHWETLGNWWTSATHDVALGRIPATGDFVYMLGETAPDTTPAAVALAGYDSTGLTAALGYNPLFTRNLSIQAGGTLAIGENQSWAGDAHLAATNTLAAGASVYLGSVGPDSVWTSASVGVAEVANVTIGDRATFYDATFGMNPNVGASITIGDDATFNGSNPHACVVMGDIPGIIRIGDRATFNGDSFAEPELGTTVIIGDDATFNDASSAACSEGSGNTVIIGKRATFNDTSYLAPYADIMTVGDGLTFNDAAHFNCVQDDVGADCIFNCGTIIWNSTRTLDAYNNTGTATLNFNGLITVASGATLNVSGTMAAAISVPANGFLKLGTAAGADVAHLTLKGGSEVAGLVVATGNTGVGHSLELQESIALRGNMTLADIDVTFTACSIFAREAGKTIDAADAASITGVPEIYANGRTLTAEDFGAASARCWGGVTLSGTNTNVVSHAGSPSLVATDGDGKVTYGNAAPPTADAIGTDAAAKILATPAQKIVTDANGKVTYANTAPPTADAIGTDAAAKILADPTHKLATDGDGKVTATGEVTIDEEALAAAVAAAVGEGLADAVAAAILADPTHKLATDGTGRVTTTSAGDGDVAVNHNAGGADALRVMHGGAGVDGATIRAYLTSEYDAGTLTIRGQAVTGTDGRWVAPMYLDAGAYTLVISKPGLFVDKVQEVTVA